MAVTDPAATPRVAELPDGRVLPTACAAPGAAAVFLPPWPSSWPSR